MSVDPVPEKKSLLKNPTLYTGLALLIVLLYVCWIFFARWNENRLLNLRTKEENAQKQREQDRAALDQLGGKDLAIQMFYASPGSIRRGPHASPNRARVSSVMFDPPSSTRVTRDR